MSDQFEVTAKEQPAEVSPVWADATERTAWGVHIPWMGEIWSYDRDLLAKWLRDAADRVQSTSEHGVSGVATLWAGGWHAQCACGQVFSGDSPANAGFARLNHIRESLAAAVENPLEPKSEK